MTPRRFKPEYVLLLTTIVGLMALVWVGETILQARYPNLILNPSPSDAGPFGLFFRFDLEYGRWHKRSVSSIWRGERYTINRHRLRDQETSYHNSVGHRRILVIGDSLVWGFGVGDGQTFSDILERELPDTEVINMGVIGYGTGEQYLLLKGEGMKYHPDIVLLVFSIGNDVEDTYFPDGGDSYPANIFYLKDGQVQIKRFHLSLQQRIGVALNERSYLVNFFLKKVFKSTDRDRPLDASNFVHEMNVWNLASVDGDRTPYAMLDYLEVDGAIGDEHVDTRYKLLPSTPDSYYKVELTKQLVLRMAGLASTSGAKFMVVLAPFTAQMDVDGPYFRNPLNREMTRFLASEGIPTLDLLPRMVKEGHDAEQFFIDPYGHFSVYGHEHVARSLKYWVTAP